MKRAHFQPIDGGAPLEPAAAGGFATETPSRQEIAPDYRWRLEDIYADDAAWEADCSRLQQRLSEGAEFQGRLGADDGAVLLRALQARDAVHLLLERLFAYAHMRCDED